MSLLDPTRLAISLIHPIAMIVLAYMWSYTALLGLRSWKTRVESPPHGESLPLLPDRLPRLLFPHHHHRLSASLVFLTTTAMFFGMLNTYLRAGRLFPSRHMYGGFIFLTLISLNVSLVPWLSSRTSARYMHKIVGVCIFCCLVNQILSGYPILSSVWRTVPW